MNTAVMEANKTTRSRTSKSHNKPSVDVEVVAAGLFVGDHLTDQVLALHDDEKNNVGYQEVGLGYQAERKFGEVSAQLLTEAELLAMPEHVYMNSAQTDFFKRRLEMMAHDITNADGRSRDTLRVADSSADPVDRASAEESYALEILTRERDAKLAVQVRQALARIASGDYGICEESGEPIGIARLLAQPTARMTTDAQNRLDQRRRTHRM